MTPSSTRIQRGDRPLAGAVIGGAGLTVLVVVLPFAHFAYENGALHLALETGEGLIAALLAYLLLQRHRATGRLQHVALAWVFAVLAFANLFLSAGPLVADRVRPGGWLTWATLGLRLVAAGALCAVDIPTHNEVIDLLDERLPAQASRTSRLHELLHPS